MHVPPHFSPPDAGATAALLRAWPLATLAAARPGALEATPVPALADLDGDRVVALRFHLARTNPLVAMLDGATPAVAVFSGPDAYISPDWYVGPDLPPTWNYAAVHVRGTPVPVAGEDLDALLADLTAESESRLDKRPWTVADMDPGRYARMREAIVGYRMPCESLEAKWKMGQNRTPADRIAAARALRAAGGGRAWAVADWMDPDPDGADGR